MASGAFASSGSDCSATWRISSHGNDITWRVARDLCCSLLKCVKSSVWTTFSVQEMYHFLLHHFCCFSSWVCQFSPSGRSATLQVWSHRWSATDQLLFALWPGTAGVTRRCPTILPYWPTPYFHKDTGRTQTIKDFLLDRLVTLWLKYKWWFQCFQKVEHWLIDWYCIDGIQCVALVLNDIIIEIKIISG